MCGEIKTKKILFAFAAFFFSLVFFSVHSSSVLASTGVNQEIDFEGKVVNTNGTNVNGSSATPYNMEFKIYSGSSNTGSGDTLLFTEDWLVGSTQGGVSVTNGTFNVNIGGAGSGDSVALSTLNFNQYPLWLSINLGSTSTCLTTFASCGGGDGEMTPYIQFDSTPYSLNAGEVGGLSSSSLVQLTPASQQSGAINVSGNIKSGGTVQANTLDAASSGNLTVGSTNATGIILNTNTTLTSGDTLTAGGQTVINGSGLVQPAALSGSYTGISGVGTVTAGTWNASVLNPAYGGTGQSSYTIGDLLYATASTTLSELHDVGTGSCLISGGSGVAPTWGSCGSSSGANAALSNLASVAINTSLLPDTTNSINVGSATLTLANGYFGTALQSPLLDAAASTALNIGTTNANTINIGATAGTASTVAVNSGATLDLGNDSINKTINVGATGSTANTTTVNIGTTTGAAQAIQLGGTGGSGNSNSGTTVELQAGSTYQDLTNSGYTLTTYTNSSTAYQIQNSAGATSLNIDDTSSAANGTQINYLLYPGFESGSFTSSSAGWAYTGGASGTLNADSTKSTVYSGSYSAQIVGSPSGSSGLTTSSFVSAPPTGTYIVSFYAKAGTSTYNVNTFSVTSTDATTHSCTGTSSNVTIPTTAFARIYCSITTTGAMTALQISNSTTGLNYYIDNVQLQSSTFNGSTISAPSPYQTSAIQLPDVVTNPIAFMASSNSTSAFQILTSGGGSLLTADTSGLLVTIGGALTATGAGTVGGTLSVTGAITASSTINSQTISTAANFTGSLTVAGGTLQVGSSTTDATQYNLQLDSFSSYADSGTCSTTTSQGAIYYNTNTNAIRGCINGAWDDLVSTAGLGITLFGVVPETGTTAGDWMGLSGSGKSPCKVEAPTSLTSITTNACTVYSGGRKNVIPSQTLALTSSNLPANDYVNVCVINNVIVLETGNATETSANLPTWSASKPIECLARLFASATGGTLAQIWDTRTFVNDTHEFATVDSVNQPSFAVVQSTAGMSVTTNTAGTGFAKGIVDSTSGTASTTATNAVVTTSGPAFYEWSTTSPTAGPSIVQTTTTAGYLATPTTTSTTNALSDFGYSEAIPDTTCASGAWTPGGSSGCEFSVPFIVHVVGKD